MGQINFFFVDSLSLLLSLNCFVLLWIGLWFVGTKFGLVGSDILNTFLKGFDKLFLYISIIHYCGHYDCWVI